MNQFGLIDHSGHCWAPNQEKGRGGETPRRLETPGRLETPRRIETPGRLTFFGIKHNASQFESVWPDRSQWSLLDPEPGEGTRRRG